MELEGETKRGAALRKSPILVLAGSNRSSSSNRLRTASSGAGQIGDCHPTVYNLLDLLAVPFLLLLLGCTTWVKTT